MRSLAEQDRTEVLEYVYDTQDKGADAVMCVKMFQLIAERRRDLGLGYTDEEAGERLKQSDPMVSEFSRNFPAICRNALDYHQAPRHLSMLKQLARIRQVVERREMSEAEANVHATRVMLEKTMRAPTEKEKASAGAPPAVSSTTPCIENTCA
jgi:hypothetical protein